MTNLTAAALRYHDEGLAVIPVKPRDKAPALDTWEQFQTRASTRAEVAQWWADCPAYNIGIVHGVGNYITVDIDHDAGALDLLRASFPALFVGRLEQSGSGQGYHLPLFVATMPDLGWDNSKDRPRGNKTWHTVHGDVNVRARWCQTVAPPSIHPTGGLYKFLQDGAVVTADNIDAMLAQLDKLDPASVKRARAAQRPQSTQPQGNSLAELKAYYPSILDAFKTAGLVGDFQNERDGNVRILKHGGLVVNESAGLWYNYSDEMGGDVIDAFGYAQFGQRWDRYNRGMFAEIVKSMKDRAGLGSVRTYCPPAVCQTQARSNYWR